MKKFSSTTKANFHRTSRKRKSAQIFFIVGGIIGIGMLLPMLFSVVSSIVLYPIHSVATWVRTSDSLIPQYVRSRADLVAELEALKNQVALNTTTELSVKRLTQENIELRGLLNDQTMEDRITARVTGRPNELPYDLIQIDKGSNAGVVVGAPVYTGVDSVVGVVARVTAQYSFVSLFTSPDYEVTAFISDIQTFAPIEGVGGGVARVRLPQGVSLKEGQLVILPGINSAIYGSIEYIESSPTEPEQYGYVVPPLSLNNLLYVTVGTNPITNRSDAEIDATVRSFITDTLTLQTTSFDFSSSSATTTVTASSTTP